MAYKFEYEFPTRIITQLSIDDVRNKTVDLELKKYTFELEHDTYWEMTAEEFIKDWFPTTAEQLSPFQYDWMKSEAIELCLAQDYDGTYDDKIAARVLPIAWKQFCDTQTRKDKYLYLDTPLDIVYEVNDMEAPR